jgi:hypothetical protein
MAPRASASRRASGASEVARQNDEPQQLARERSSGSEGARYEPQAGAEEDVPLSKRRRLLAGAAAGAAAAEDAAEDAAADADADANAAAATADYTAAVAGSPEAVVNAYERERADRIRRNQAVLQRMGLREMASDLAAEGAGPAARPPARRAAPPPRAAGAGAPLAPSRRSARAAGLPAPGAPPPGGAAAAALGGAAAGVDPALEDELLTIEEFFAARGKDMRGALRATGFRGWVPADVAAAHGVVSRAAWEAGAAAAAAGGGAAGGGKAAAKASAKAWAATQLRGNPNAYFYRHVAPGATQAKGAWSEAEHARFLAIAKEHGFGDLWGVFAAQMRTRVGYQCRAYYFEVVVPSGLVLDAKLRLTRRGKAVLTGE